MTNAKKCDRCGKLYELYDGYEVVKGGNMYNTLGLFNHWDSAIQSYDLCPECMESLIKWIKEKEAKNG